MARNSSGTYTAPAGQPVVAGTVIDPTVFNSLVTDLGTELTDSLSRSGKGGMTAPLRTADGTVTAPAHAFTGETGSGLYRIGANNPGMAVNGSKKQEWTAAGTKVTGTFESTGAATVGGTLDVTGAATLSGGIVGSFTRANMPTVGQQVSTSCGAYTTTSGSFVDVTNLSVSITTAGRPVILIVQSAGSAYPDGSQIATASTHGTEIAVLRDSTVISRWLAGPLTSIAPILHLDAPAAATYTYKMQVRSLQAGETTSILHFRLVAYEL